MQKSPFDSWLQIQERKRNHTAFILEWVAVFLIAWLFWCIVFYGAPGAVPPGLVATLVAGLYASSVVYGRLMAITGCRKCACPLPLVRKEIGRRHLRDQEKCIEVQYGGEEWGQEMIQVYCKICRTDIVTYCCRRCDQVWDEQVELPGTGYKLIRRIDP